MGKGRGAPNLVTHLTPQKAKSNKKKLPPMGPLARKDGRDGRDGRFRACPWVMPEVKHFSYL
jgi:hypothetical protein